jgi:ubiquinone/menaquinone biosynthesis C-methylase UbiE
VNGDAKPQAPLPGPAPESAAIRSEYDRLARQYDRRWEAYTQATLRATIERFTVAEGERVLDVGCGTGVLLDALARTSPRALLFGLDISRKMLAVARRRGAGVSRLVAGDVASLPFAAGRFDVVVSTNAFHFWIDPAAALRELRRVLTPAGRLIVTDWCHDYLACRWCDAVLKLFRRIPHRSYPSSECAALIRAAGFQIERLDRYKINWLWGMMTVAARSGAG